jgi:hypothetical protein
MFGLGRRDGDDVEAAPAGGPVTLDLALEFEPGFAVLSGPGVRFRLRREAVETLVGGKTAAVRKFQEVASPARGVFDLEKTAKIARWLHHGLGLEQCAKIFGEPSAVTREYYGWAIRQGSWGDNSAQEKLAELAELDRVRSIAPVPGGVVKDATTGRFLSIVSGTPIPELFTRLHAVEVARTLRAAGGDVKEAAKKLQVAEDDLQRWMDANGEMLALL